MTLVLIALLFFLIEDKIRLGLTTNGCTQIESIPPYLLRNSGTTALLSRFVFPFHHEVVIQPVGKDLAWRNRLKN